MLWWSIAKLNVISYSTPVKRKYDEDSQKMHRYTRIALAVPDARYPIRTCYTLSTVVIFPTAQGKALEKQENKPLSPKEAIVVRGLLTGMTQKEAMTAAGYSESNASKGSRAILDRPHIKTAIQQAMAAKGLTPDRLTEVIVDGLAAEKTIAAGEEVHTSDDHATRHKFLDTALKLGNHYPPKQTEEVKISYEERILQIRQRRGDHA